MKIIKEGMLYKSTEVEGARFELYYGYESDEERTREWEPTVLYPDFTEHPQYTSSGFRLATAFQDVCPHYKKKPTQNDDDWCDLCEHFAKGDDLIGVCRCEYNRRNNLQK